MIDRLVSDAKHTARATARAAAMSVLGTIFAMIGLGFLTVALWLLLAAQEGALFAATVIGVLYCAVGFMILALATRGKSKTHHTSPTHAHSAHPSHPAHPDGRAPLMQLAEGFALGMQAGRSARSD